MQKLFIVGLFSGIMGIGITILLLIPINLIIHSFNTDITAVLPFTGGTIFSNIKCNFNINWRINTF